MQAQLFVKLAELAISNAPTASHPLQVSPSLGHSLANGAGRLAGGAYNLGSNLLGRAGRLASGASQIASGATIAPAVSAYRSAAPLLDMLPGQKGFHTGAANSLLGSTGSAVVAGAKDMGSAFLPRQSGSLLPSAGQANVENNAQWLEAGGQPGAASLTRSAWHLGNNAAEAVPTAAALGGLGRATTLPAMPQAAPGALNTVKDFGLSAARGTVPFVANTAAQMTGMNAVMPEAGKQMQYGLDRAGLGELSRGTSQIIGQGVNAIDQRTGGFGGQALLSLSPYLLPGPLRGAALASQMTPFVSQPVEQIDAATGQTHQPFNPTTGQANPPPLHNATQPASVTPVSPARSQDIAGPGDNAPPPTSPADALSPANNPPVPPPESHPMQMFSQLADMWGKMDPHTQMALLAGGGLGLMSLTGGHALTPLMGLALTGLAAHHGLLGTQAQGLMQGLTKNVSDRFSNLGSQSGGDESKSEASARTTSPAMSLNQMRAIGGRPTDEAAKSLVDYLATDNKTKMSLRSLPYAPDSMALPALQKEMPGFQQSDLDRLRKVYNQSRSLYPKQVQYQHNLPARSLDAIDTIRNNVNVNGNIPAANQA